MDNSNPFASITTQGLEDAKDVLGGNFGAVDSGVYPTIVKLAYAGKSSGGADSMTFAFEIDVNGQKREYREVVYVTSKLGKNSYERDGKQFPLPGFTHANDIALVITGHELNALNFESKIVKIYDYDQKAEVQTSVMMAVDLIGKPVTLAILRETVNKQVKNANGNYVDVVPPQTRDQNVIDKVFHAESGRTVSEIVRKLEKGEFLEPWKAKNTGVTRDKTTKKAGTAGMPGQGTAPAAGTSIFK